MHKVYNIFMAEKEKKKSAVEWFIAFQKIQAVAFIGLALATGSAGFWTAAIVDTTAGVIGDAEYKKWKKKKGKK